jgi:DegV family protein with EDD domain
MSGVRIVTDSACDLSDDDVTEHGITVVPLSIRFGSDEYVDREELSVERFYALMDSTGLLPETAAPSPGRFEQAFRDAADSGADAVVCINLSSALSATMQSAQAAAKALEGQVDVRVIDSRSITGGLGTMVLAAAEQAGAGADADAIVATIEGMIPRSDVYGALSTLDNLKKGGRIGGAQAMLGSMLSVKPLIRIVDGAVAEAGKPRTRKRALEALRDKLEEAGQVESVSVLHGEAADIDEFLDMISDLHPRDTVRVGKIGAVIGAHGGPGVIGVCFLHPAP